MDNTINQMFINAIGAKPEQTFLISSECENYNGIEYATFEVAQEMANELTRAGYKTNVLNPVTGEILHEGE